MADASSVASAASDLKSVAALCEHLAAQISLTGKGDSDAIKAAAAAFETLANNHIVIAEPFITANFTKLINAANNKDKSIREAVTSAVKAFAAKMSPDNARAMLPLLFSASKGEGLQGGVAFNVRVLALSTISSMSENAPEQLGFALPSVVPELTISMSDPKKDVAKAAHDALVSVCDVIGNRDIEHMTAKIVRLDAEVTDFELFHVRVVGGLMGGKLGVLEHVQHGCLAGVVEAEEQDLGILGPQPEIA